MEKLNEMLIGILAVIGAWLAKKLWKNIGTVSDRITALEKVMLTKEDLNGLERNVDMIVTHLITKGKK